MSYPLVLILVKLLSVFNAEEELKKLNIELSSYEGTFEAIGQLCVQFFIVFQRADKAPSWLQWLTIAQNLWAERVGSVDEIQIKACPSGLPTS